MDIRKYLPKFGQERKDAIRQKKKDTARLQNYEELLRTFFSQRETSEQQIMELEKRLERVSEVVKAANEVQKANQELQEIYATLTYLKLVGSRSRLGHLDGDEKTALDYLFEKGNLEVNLAKIIEEKEREIDSLREKNKEYKNGHLVSNVAAACHGARIERVPVMLYEAGKILYISQGLEKMVGDKYAIEMDLEKNEMLKMSLAKKKRAIVDYNGGKLFFVPEKFKEGNVSIAYFVPGGDKKYTKIFRKYGEKAVNTIYKTMINLEKAGIGIHYGKE